jgi:hypothetical protein
MKQTFEYFMPINFQQALTKIREMGARAGQRAHSLAERRAQAIALLRAWTGREDELRELVERAVRLNPHLRTAVPAVGRLDAAVSAADRPGAVLLAADGSQIYPDRHAAVEFGAINVGAIRLCPGETPRETVDSQLLFYEELYIDSVPLNEAIVALRRDKEERAMLLTLAEAEVSTGRAVVTLTDGPLELYGQDQNSAIYKKTLLEYLDVLRGLARLGVGAAGYVDKPRSDYLVNLLELALLAEENNLGQAGREHPLFPVHDVDLFTGILQPGQRTAVFSLRTPAAENFKDELALHFFYLNVGRPSKPHLARVEIPRWVAADLDLLETIQSALLGQARQMGAQPYPYIIHRAHEIAVVSFAEKDQLENLIAAELRRNGVEVGEKSAKQFAKDS